MTFRQEAENLVSSVIAIKRLLYQLDVCLLAV
jgi:hypothetical protein